MIDKRLLIDKATIEKVTGKDEWGKEEYGVPLFLSPVKFDRSSAFVGSGKSRSESKPSVLFVYPRYCDVVLDGSYRGGRLTVDGEEYIIRQVITQYQPFTKKVLCYEVEVV